MFVPRLLRPLLRVWIVLRVAEATEVSDGSGDQQLVTVTPDPANEAELAADDPQDPVPVEGGDDQGSLSILVTVAKVGISSAILICGEELKESILLLNAATAAGIDMLIVKLQMSEFSPLLLVETMQVLLGTLTVSFITIRHESAAQVLQAGNIFSTGFTVVVPLVRGHILRALGCSDLDPQELSVDWPEGIPVCESEESLRNAGWVLKALSLSSTAFGAAVAPFIGALVTIVNSAMEGGQMLIDVLLGDGLSLVNPQFAQSSDVQWWLAAIAMPLFAVVAVLGALLQIRLRASRWKPRVTTSGNTWKLFGGKGRAPYLVENALRVPMTLKSAAAKDVLEAVVCLGKPDNERSIRLHLGQDLSAYAFEGGVETLLDRGQLHLEGGVCTELEAVLALDSLLFKVVDASGITLLEAKLPEVGQTDELLQTRCAKAKLCRCLKLCSPARCCKRCCKFCHARGKSSPSDDKSAPKSPWAFSAVSVQSKDEVVWTARSAEAPAPSKGKKAKCKRCMACLMCPVAAVMMVLAGCNAVVGTAAREPDELTPSKLKARLLTWLRTDLMPRLRSLASKGRGGNCAVAPGVGAGTTAKDPSSETPKVADDFSAVVPEAGDGSEASHEPESEQVPAAGAAPAADRGEMPPSQDGEQPAAAEQASAGSEAAQDPESERKAALPDAAPETPAAAAEDAEQPPNSSETAAVPDATPETPAAAAEDAKQPPNSSETVAAEQPAESAKSSEEPPTSPDADVGLDDLPDPGSGAPTPANAADDAAPARPAEPEKPGSSPEEESWEPPAAAEDGQSAAEPPPAKPPADHQAEAGSAASLGDCEVVLADHGPSKEESGPPAQQAPAMIPGAPEEPDAHEAGGGDGAASPDGVPESKPPSLPPTPRKPAGGKLPPLA